MFYVIQACRVRVWLIHYPLVFLFYAYTYITHAIFHCKFFYNKTLKNTFPHIQYSYKLTNCYFNTQAELLYDSKNSINFLMKNKDMKILNLLIASEDNESRYFNTNYEKKFRIIWLILSQDKIARIYTFNAWPNEMDHLAPIHPFIMLVPYTDPV